jgi:adenosylcobinamide-GDP ribazoletransferase
VGDAVGSKSKPLTDQISISNLIAGFLWLFIALALLIIASNASLFDAIKHIFSGLLLALLSWFWMWRLLKNRLGGFTGDGLGATQQLTEVGFLMGVLLG